MQGTTSKNKEECPNVKTKFQPFNAKNFANLIQNVDAEEQQIEDQQKSSKYLPIDWSLKTRLRILCSSSLPGIALKTSQEASGLTSFVRCIGTDTPSGLDISPSARFHQSTFYWQHPHLPWLTLFPRNSKANVGIKIGDAEKTSLAKEWSESFRGLFQLVRARQCPYFYFCANTFIVLFRAAGIGGRIETHAIMTPTSRGMRSALKQEGIEYIQPFSKHSNLNRSDEASTSFEEKSQDTSKNNSIEKSEDNNDDDDLEEEEWLESLGVDSNEIKKISLMHFKEKLRKEMADDFSDNSLVVIEGVGCQAFFNFLLNAKSTTSNIGRLAGIPPTLLAPVAFPGATMRSLQTRSSKVRMDGVDYYSIELKGPILPHTLPYICNLLTETKDSFSATLAAHNSTLALTKASQKLIEDTEKENTTADQVFGKENLSDCGLQTKITESMCRVSSDASCLMERMWYNKDIGYTWS